jgi:hypothetical protein
MCNIFRCSCIRQYFITRFGLNGHLQVYRLLYFRTLLLTVMRFSFSCYFGYVGFTWFFFCNVWCIVLELFNGIYLRSVVIMKGNEKFNFSSPRITTRTTVPHSLEKTILTIISYSLRNSLRSFSHSVRKQWESMFFLPTQNHVKKPINSSVWPQTSQTNNNTAHTYFNYLLQNGYYT